MLPFCACMGWDGRALGLQESLPASPRVSPCPVKEIGQIGVTSEASISTATD